MLPASPFLLPCAVTAALGILTTIINILFMEETLSPLSKRGGYCLIQQSSLGAAHGELNHPPTGLQPPRRLTCCE